jgi:cytoskeletal protein CcmA (bactofilin family)
MFSKSNKPSTSVPQSRTPQANTSLSIIARDVTITGNISTAGEIQLDGVVNGDVTCGAITLGETGHLTGALVATTATIRGHVDGTIRAKSVLLERTAVITGDVTQESISIEAGAKVEGRFLSRDNPHEIQAPLLRSVQSDGAVAPIIAAMI